MRDRRYPKYNSPRWIIKLGLSLSILVSVILLIFFAYKAFTHQFAPTNGAISVLLTLGVLVWLIRTTTKHPYKYTKPGFLLVTFIALIIFLITAFAGVSPMSNYKDKVSTMLSSTNNTAKKIISPDYPYGTYTATVFGITQTATFKPNNILEMYDKFEGKRVFSYSINQNGTIITATNIVTNQTTSMNFRYVKSQECVVFEDISYFK
jgi:glucan phosphoethanolaminetransferase (alkaline phosphatase superfamily)